MKWSKRSTRAEKKSAGLPLYFYILSGIALLALAVYLTAVISPRFADWYNGTVGAAFRAVLAHATSFLPFSLAEILLYSLPVVAVLLIVHAYRHHTHSWKSTGIFIACLLSVGSIFFSLFAFSFGVGYHTHTLDERLSIGGGEYDVEELSRVTLLVAESANREAAGLTYAENGFSDMPYDLKALNDRLLDAYSAVGTEVPFLQSLDSRIKPVLASRLMSYTHITGVYSYFTGEANLNVAFPDWTLPFTAAHELAHQRGIAREDEANFIAFLVTVAADDAYIRYSGYLNLFEYLYAALWSADRDAAVAVLEQLDDRVRGELIAQSAFFDRYRDSAVGELSGAVNDLYLKAHGNRAGTDSYGLVVDLAVAYYQKK